MREENGALTGVSGALRGFQIASRTVKALRYAQIAAMGCAAASLVLGGVRLVRQYRD